MYADFGACSVIYLELSQDKMCYAVEKADNFRFGRNVNVFFVRNMQEFMLLKHRKCFGIVKRDDILEIFS